MEAYACCCSFQTMQKCFGLVRCICQYRYVIGVVGVGNCCCGVSSASIFTETFKKQFFLLLLLCRSPFFPCLFFSFSLCTFFSFSFFFSFFFWKTENSLKNCLLLLIQSAFVGGIFCFFSSSSKKKRYGASVSPCSTPATMSKSLFSLSFFFFFSLYLFFFFFFFFFFFLTENRFF